MRNLPDEICLNAAVSTLEVTPFPHFYSQAILKGDLPAQLYTWFEHTEAWGLTETEFYTQYEFSLLDASLPQNLECLKSEATIESIRDIFREQMSVSTLSLVGITAHKLNDGHRIGVHNDYIDGEETHRLVIQVNPHWDESKGGYLMLFNSQRADDVAKIVKPLNNSAFGFEISIRSNHAVSTVYDFSRYTLVYTFKAID